jgi:hypothetical protein
MPRWSGCYRYPTRPSVRIEVADPQHPLVLYGSPAASQTPVSVVVSFASVPRSQPSRLQAGERDGRRQLSPRNVHATTCEVGATRGASGPHVARHQRLAVQAAQGPTTLGTTKSGHRSASSLAPRRSDTAGVNLWRSATDARRRSGRWRPAPAAPTAPHDPSRRKQ